MISLFFRSVSIAFAISSCVSPDPVSEENLRPVVPSGFEAVPIPSHNPLTKAKVLLGEQLFFDATLSIDSTVSCSTCHIPEKFFSDGQIFSQGIHGRIGTRNTPSLINMAYHNLLFWDGGSITLEHQVFGPLQNPTEMGLDLASVLHRLNSDPTYRQSFLDVFEEPPTLRGLTQALGAYQRTLLSGGARYDSYKAGDGFALNVHERRGLKLFEEKARCTHCHNGFLLSNLKFENNGLSISQGDSGRARITGLKEDYGKFKVPSLRNISETAPYMHDGRMGTLSEVIDHYNHGGENVRGQSGLIQPLNLSESEKEDLEAFLHSLTDSITFAGVERP